MRLGGLSVNQTISSTAKFVLFLRPSGLLCVEIKLPRCAGVQDVIYGMRFSSGMKRANEGRGGRPERRVRPTPAQVTTGRRERSRLQRHHPLGAESLTLYVLENGAESNGNWPEFRVTGCAKENRHVAALKVSHEL